MKKIFTAAVLSTVLAMFSYGREMNINMNLDVQGMAATDGAAQQQAPVPVQQPKKHAYKVLKAVLNGSSIDLSDGRSIPVTYTKALFPYPKVEILEPAGAKVILSQDGEEDYKGEAPLIWKDAEIDAYIKMTVYEQDGSAWVVKFQAKKQRDITIGSRDAAAAMPAGEVSGFNSKHFTIEKKVYGVGEAFSARFHNMPGNKTDWISVVPAGVPASYWGEWSYTNGAKDGVFPVAGHAEGKFELRAYYNHPDGGFTIMDVMEFEVKIQN